MKKLLWLPVTILGLALSTVAIADVISGPIPLGNSSVVKGARCKFRDHTGSGHRTMRIRRADGLIVAEWAGATSNGNDYVLNASYFSLLVPGNLNTRALCEIFPATSGDQFNTGNVTATLSSMANTNEVIESVEGVSGASGPATYAPGVSPQN